MSIPTPVSPEPDRWAKIAVFAAAAAAFAGFLSVIATSCSNSYQHQLVEVETQPILQLSCSEQFKLLERSLAKDTYFVGLEPFPWPMDFTSKVPTYDANGYAFDLPLLYPKCTLTNFGRMPMMNVKLDISPTFFPRGLGGPMSYAPHQIIAVPGLSPNGGTYVFNLANSTALDLMIGFRRKVNAVIFEPGPSPSATDVPLVVDDGVEQIEHQLINAAPRRLVFPSPPPRVRTPSPKPASPW